MLQLELISKTWNRGTIDSRMALNRLSLTLDEGDFLTVIGGNGSGKSTMLNIIAGVHMPDSGRVLIDGKDVTGLPPHRRARYIGRVFQDPLLGSAAKMTIEENLALAARRGKARGLKWGIKADERKYFRQLLSQLDLGLEDRMGSCVGTLSGGQRQALTLLMASLSSPRLLLLDEHTAALDPKTGAKVLAISKKIIEDRRLTAIMVTHSMKDAIDCGNRLIMLDQGRILYQAQGEEKQKLTVMDLLARFHQGQPMAG